MSRKTLPPKPMFALKHDFYESLDAHLQQGIMLLQAVEQAIDLGKIEGITADHLRERVAAFRKTLLTEE